MSIRVVLFGAAMAAALASPPLVLAQDTAVQKSLIAQVDEARDKILDLAQATPEERYSFSPGKGVRTTGQVFLHVASINYLFSAFLGFKPPAELHAARLESSGADKAKTIELLKSSFAHAENAIRNTKDSDLDKPIDIFGTQGTIRDMEFMILTHAHEHLGQSIAYARMNGITPPWTARQEAAAAEAVKPK